MLSFFGFLFVFGIVTHLLVTLFDRRPIRKGKSSSTSFKGLQEEKKTKASPQDEIKTLIQKLEFREQKLKEREQELKEREKIFEDFAKAEKKLYDEIKILSQKLESKELKLKETQQELNNIPHFAPLKKISLNYRVS